MVTGTEGALLIGNQAMLLPEAEFKDYPRPKLEDRNHYHHFADACLGTAKNEAILLDVVALRVPNDGLASRGGLPGVTLTKLKAAVVE
ncbi:MAG: hypothetical protein HYY24_05950 [Verrucomicrobia bacterium]|nr:hypothetical protein [Verrucomicrobiota bacterium]